jgi:anthranilate phosphoribosyltransferase
MAGLVTMCPPHEGNESLPPLEVAAGLIAAGAGVRVLMVLDLNVPPKRGVSSANVLERLGCGLTWDPSEAEDWVAKARFAAICAPGMLPPLAQLRDVRRDLGLRTPLSTAVKLLAPKSSSVVLGAMSGPVLGTAVEVMQSLSHPSGMAIQGLEGGLVPTLRKRSRGIHLDGNHQVPLTIDPGDFGLGGPDDAELPMFGPPEEGQGTADNPEIVRAACDANRAVLAGEHGPGRSHALLTAAVLLRTARIAPTFADGVAKATESLDSGAASEVLARLGALLR